MADKKPLAVSDKFVKFTFEQALIAHQIMMSNSERAFELIELEKLNAALDWNDWHDKLSEDIEAENSEPVETKTDYCHRMGFDM